MKDKKLRAGSNREDRSVNKAVKNSSQQADLDAEFLEDRNHVEDVDEDVDDTQDLYSKSNSPSKRLRQTFQILSGDFRDHGADYFGEELEEGQETIYKNQDSTNIAERTAVFGNSGNNAFKKVQIV